MAGFAPSPRPQFGGPGFGPRGPGGPMLQPIGMDRGIVVICMELSDDSSFRSLVLVSAQCVGSCARARVVREVCVRILRAHTEGATIFPSTVLLIL